MWALFAAGLVAITGFHCWDHAVWVTQDTSPLINADSPMHTLQVADMWCRWTKLEGFSIPYHAGTYPPAFHILAVLVFRVVGPSISALRLTAVGFTLLGTVGIGVLAARALGRPVGLAAAAAAWTFPAIWAERAEVQLDLPLAGAMAMAFAFLPSPRKPGTRWLAVAGGLGMTLALLTKQAMLPIAAAGLGWLGLRALVLWLRSRTRGDAESARAHLVDTAITCGIVAVIAGLHHNLAWGAIHGAMDHIYELAPPLEGRAWLASKLGLLARFAHSFLQAPQAVGLVVGLACLPFLTRRTALLGPVFLGLVAGLAQLAHFPNPHERHFVALAPLVLVLALAPLGLLRGAWWRRGLQLVFVAAIGIYGLSYSWSWRTGHPLWGGAAVQQEGMDFDAFTQMHDPAEALRWLVARPDRFSTVAPSPQNTDWPQEAIIEEITTLVPPPGPHEDTCRDLAQDPTASVALVLEGVPPDSSLQAYANLLREHRVRFLGVVRAELEGRVHGMQGSARGPERLLLLACEQEGSDTPQVDVQAQALGFQLVRSWRASTREGAPPMAISLWSMPNATIGSSR